MLRFQVKTIIGTYTLVLHLSVLETEPLANVGLELVEGGGALVAPLRLLRGVGGVQALLVNVPGILDQREINLYV